MSSFGQGLDPFAFWVTSICFAVVIACIIYDYLIK